MSAACIQICKSVCLLYRMKADVTCLFYTDKHEENPFKIVKLDLYKSDQNYWQLWTACLHALRALSSRTSGSSNSFDAVRRRCSSSFMQHCTARSFRLHHLKSSVFIEVQWHCLIHRGLTHPLKDTDVVFKAFLSLLIVGLIDFTQMTGSMQTASGFPPEFPPLFWHIYLLVCPQKPFILRCFFYTTIHLKSLDY